MRTHVPRLAKAGRRAAGRVGLGLWLAAASAAVFAQAGDVAPVAADSPARPSGASAAASPATSPNALPAAAHYPEDGLRERPLWEAGLGLAGLNLADYRGSAHRRTLWLPLPYLIYRGRWLRADREGARAVLLDTRVAEVDVSLGGSAPAASDDNPLRAGMADLPATVEIGPNVNLTLWGGGAARHKLDLRLPLRAVFTVQRSPRSIGAVFEPVLNLDLVDQAGWNIGAQAGPMFGSGRYHRHFYAVDPAEATGTRPAHAARAGYAGWKALASLSRRQGAWWFGGYLRHDDLHGAVVADSPLVERRASWSGGLALAWIFASSTQTVRTAD
ncbi:MipA/OmpV family protein [Sphaerotilus microaerophilus]|uniref:MipA/OmpV family protein n=1 Tax=Sphaerotilus microaerophilus TaxID=2914710 RepID=A0ABM7YS69_9BURK|nr:MipA/OmpV family protein [Sphaerotilus sp. FB-5]BDI07445.1 hypothetical protein CATMQ487_44150 [Sphaerotilus sp. FB-5]